MSCVEGVSYQCSGADILRTNNGVALTRSGVQVYGRSTGDVLNPTNANIATGLALATGGTAEIRSHRTGGNPDKVALLLKNMGIRWDATSERPQIIELFDPTGPLDSLSTSRVELGGSGALVYSTLPPTSDLGFYDFGTLGANGTQAHYANNRYFPRTDPARCDTPPCATAVSWNCCTCSGEAHLKPMVPPLAPQADSPLIGSLTPKLMPSCR